jgi:raffinose/stachyose/melibiose transport system substrate-binding protein
MTATSVLYVNLEVLGECGLQPARTYSELVAQVPILRARGYETVLMANRETWVMQSCLFSLVAGRFCGEGWEQRILSGEAKFTDSDFVAALNCIKAMYDDGVLRRTSISASYGDVVGQFAANKGAYYIEGDWGVAAFVTNATGQALISPDRQRNIQITVFPDIDLPGVKFNRSSSVVLGTGWGISAAIPAGSPREEAAWRLVKWLAGREVLAWRVQTGGVLAPSRIDIDMTNLMLQPMQAAIGNLGREYDRGTVVIDAVFDGPVYAPLNDGLQAIGMGRQSPQQVAQVVQAAFDAWKARQ